MPLLTCPNDNAAMQAINRNGVEIDVCPQCRAVWLDRGELEKLLGQLRAADQTEGQERERFERDRQEFYRDPDAYRRSHPQPPPQHHGYGERGEYGEKGEYGERGYDPRYGYKKKRGLDFFDFFD